MGKNFGSKGHHWKLSDIARKNIRNGHKGQIPHNKGIPMSDGQKEKIRRAHIKRWDILGRKNTKSLHSNWECIYWRKKVFERDNFTCQKYGLRGGELEAHHINNFADFPELRFVIDNGITLSKKVHKEFHKIYGKRNNTREQLEEFFKNKYQNADQTLGVK